MSRGQSKKQMSADVLAFPPKCHNEGYSRWAWSQQAAPVHCRAMSLCLLSQREREQELSSSQAKTFLVQESFFMSKYFLTSSYSSRPGSISASSLSHWVAHMFCSTESKIKSVMFIILLIIMNIICFIY